MSIRYGERSHSTQFSAVSNEIYAASLSPVDWPSLLRGIRHALHSEVIFVASYDIAAVRGSICRSDNVSETFRRSYASHPSIGDLWPKTILDSIVRGKVWTTEDIFAGGGQSAGRFYLTWLLPLGATHLMCCMIGRGSTEISYIAVGRGEKPGSYKPQEALLYADLVSQVHHVTERQYLMGQLRNIGKANHEVLDLLPVGVVVLDGHDRPILANRYAKDVLGSSWLLDRSTALQKYVEIGLRRRRPAIDLSQRNSAGAGQGVKGRMMLVQRPLGERPLSGVLYSLNGTVNEGNKDSPAAVMFISDPDHAIRIDRERLQCFYGLTPAEARVAALLAEGHRLEEAAKALGISLNTARTHLKRTFSKTGSRTQADLVRLVLDLSVRIGC